MKSYESGTRFFAIGATCGGCGGSLYLAIHLRSLYPFLGAMGAWLVGFALAKITQVRVVSGFRDLAAIAIFRVQSRRPSAS